MQHSAIRNKSETLPIFVKTNVTDDICDIYMLREDNSFIDTDYIPSSVEIDDELYKTELTTPNEDCLLCIRYKNQPIVIVVGDPTKRFIYYRVNEGQTVPYRHIDHDGLEISSGNLIELAGGFYAYTITSQVPSIIEVDGKHYPVKFPYTNASGSTISGTIKLQNNVWQLIAVPRSSDKVKEYFVDRLALKYSTSADNLIEICTAYFGDENKFRSYIPGVTNPTTTNNFPLIYGDGLHSEVTGFWVKTKDMTGHVPDIDNVVFDWSQD